MSAEASTVVANRTFGHGSYRSCGRFPEHCIFRIHSHSSHHPHASTKIEGLLCPAEVRGSGGSVIWDYRACSVHFFTYIHTLGGVKTSFHVSLYSEEIASYVMSGWIADGQGTRSDRSS
jgi:hypothetical protein